LQSASTDASHTYLNLRVAAPCPVLTKTSLPSTEQPETFDRDAGAGGPDCAKALDPATREKPTMAETTLNDSIDLHSCQ
jgi:hypothetical protein